MDFLRLIRSVEELLYEVMTWLVFYPRTMWRIVAHPADMMRYSEDEEDDDAADQYTDTLSPPLFLMLTILLAHGMELGLGLEMPAADTPVAKALWGSEQNTLALRSLMFSLFPLVAAISLLRRRGLPLDRRTLRRPFFSQCYLAAPFCLVVSLGLQLGRTSPAELRLAGTVIAVLGVLWYLGVEASWFRRLLDVGRGRAALVAVGSFTQALFFNLVVAAALVALTGGLAR